MDHQQAMQLALEQAKKAEALDEVPVGAVVVLNGEVIAAGHNQPIAEHDPTAHAEIIAMRRAAKKLENYRLLDATLYVTLEPCAMCAAAMVHARIKEVVYGASDPKAGAVDSVLKLLDTREFNHRVTYQGGVLEAPCRDLLRAFFRRRR